MNVKNYRFLSFLLGGVLFFSNSFSPLTALKTDLLAPTANSFKTELNKVQEWGLAERLGGYFERVGFPHSFLEVSRDKFEQAYAASEGTFISFFHAIYDEKIPAEQFQQAAFTLASLIPQTTGEEKRDLINYVEVFLGAAVYQTFQNFNGEPLQIIEKLGPVMDSINQINRSFIWPQGSRYDKYDMARDFYRRVRFLLRFQGDPDANNIKSVLPQPNYEKWSNKEILDEAVRQINQFDSIQKGGIVRKLTNEEKTKKEILKKEEGVVDIDDFFIDGKLIENPVWPKAGDTVIYAEDDQFTVIGQQLILGNPAKKAKERFEETVSKIFESYKIKINALVREKQMPSRFAQKIVDFADTRVSSLLKKEVFENPEGDLVVSGKVIKMIGLLQIHHSYESFGAGGLGSRYRSSWFDSEGSSVLIKDKAKAIYPIPVASTVAEMKKEVVQFVENGQNDEIGTGLISIMDAGFSLNKEFGKSLHLLLQANENPLIPALLMEPPPVLIWDSHFTHRDIVLEIERLKRFSQVEKIHDNTAVYKSLDDFYGDIYLAQGHKTKMYQARNGEFLKSDFWSENHHIQVLGSLIQPQLNPHFVEQKYLYGALHNVDNLLGGVSPFKVGMLAITNVALINEVCPKRPGEKGGALKKFAKDKVPEAFRSFKGKRLGLIESFELPKILKDPERNVLEMLQQPEKYVSGLSQSEIENYKRVAEHAIAGDRHFNSANFVKHEIRTEAQIIGLDVNEDPNVIENKLAQLHKKNSGEIKLMFEYILKNQLVYEERKKSVQDEEEAYYPTILAGSMTVALPTLFLEYPDSNLIWGPLKKNFRNVARDYHRLQQLLTVEGNARETLLQAAIPTDSTAGQAWLRDYVKASPKKSIQQAMNTEEKELAKLESIFASHIEKRQSFSKKTENVKLKMIPQQRLTSYRSASLYIRTVFNRYPQKQIETSL